ncbi:MAG: glycosyltransferase [Bacteroidetes bacterium]|nr:glycosyltransferase [Bacteroidota bacterium]MCL6098795.1 glycosyltransferase [Bacteroidota bacterium]
MFEIIFVIAVSLYFLELIIFTVGVGKKYKKIDDKNLPSISIVVAARNEEDNIIDCMTSLNNLIYPEDKIEIIIVNDHSTDSTADLIDSFIKDKPKFKTVVPSESIGHLKGKTNALANAIKISKGEVLLTTDADCIVSPTWAKTLASYYQDDVGFVGGFTTQYDRSAFEGMQAIDFVYLLTVAAGSINLGKPLSCIGNNMSYRRSAYLAVGGYEGLPFSVTEDFKLLMAIHDLKKYKIIYPLDAKGLVTSKACPDWKTLFWQKKRWGVGGKESDFIGYMVLVWGYLSSVAVLLTPFLFISVALYLSIFKFGVDYFFVKPIFNKLNLKLKFTHFLAFEIYFILYVILLPFIVLPSKKVKWKGRTF